MTPKVRKMGYNKNYLMDRAARQPYKGNANWIWNADNKGVIGCRTLVSRTFEVTDINQKATLLVATDDISSVYFNGEFIGKTENWDTMFQFDLTGKLVEGQNIITIDAEDTGSLPCGVLAELRLADKTAFVTDKSWLAKPLETDVKFDPKSTEGFMPAIILTPYGGGAWGTGVLFKKN